MKTIDLNRQSLSRKGGNGGRRRRFSTDPAKCAYYAAFRNSRFSKRLGFS